MRRTPAIQLVGLLALASFGCGESDPAPAPVTSPLDEARAIAERGESEAAVEAYRRVLTGMPDGADAANARWELALELHTLQRFDEMLIELDRALAFRRAESPTRWEELQRVLNSRADALYRLGRYPDAERDAREAVSIATEHGMRDTRTEAIVRYTLGAVLVEQRHLDGAIVELLRARELYERLESGSQYHVESIELLAVAYDYAERYTEAETLFREVLRLREANGGARDSQTGVALANLALNLDYQERHADAVPLFERAIGILEATLGPRHPRTATAKNGLGSSLVSLGQLDRAGELFAEVLSIREQTYGPNHPAVAVALYNLSSIRLDQQRPAEALPLVERALAIREATLPPDHPWLVATRERHQELLAQLGRAP